MYVTTLIKKEEFLFDLRVRGAWKDWEVGSWEWLNGGKGGKNYIVLL